MAVRKKLAFYTDSDESELFADDSDNDSQYIQPFEASSDTDSENQVRIAWYCINPKKISANVE